MEKGDKKIRIKKLLNKIVMNKSILLVLIFLAGIHCIQGAVYHIDPSAKQNGDGSADNPFQSWNDLRR